MLLCETVAACTLLRGPGIYRAVASKRDQNVLQQPTAVSSEGPTPNRFQSSTTRMSDFIKADLGSLHGVSNVSVRSSNGQYHVSVYLRDFTRASRRMVYSKELSLVREFPSLSFGFNVIDASQATIDGALCS